VAQYRDKLPEPDAAPGKRSPGRCPADARLAPVGHRQQGPPEPTAAWQAWQVEHGVPEEHWNDASAITDPDSSGPHIYFQHVPEPKAVKANSL
jgi:hypothetical protein